MGNSTSSQSVNASSVRSRGSRKTPVANAEPSRLSQAVSFYQTPPGSFDLGKRPMSSTSTDVPMSPDIGSFEPKAASHESYTESIASTKPEPKQLKWKAGVYSLINVKSNSAMDLSAADDQSLIGFPPHTGRNQQWKFEPLGEGYTIRSISSGRYLTVADSVVNEGALVASHFPVSWKVSVVSEGEEVRIRVLWPNGRHAISLADSGSDKAGTKVQLATAQPERDWQLWRLIEREDPTPASPPEQQLIRREEAALAGPPPVETVVVAEAPEGITTTRITTSVSLTTVTVVTKTPRNAPQT
ncbi:hypothetical protein BDW22DRAFT_1362432 [Trametopsis cervina]|nr:hypothetical protein BDW22DRAFT_1362432 [Trametopsis cervina]